MRKTILLFTILFAFICAGQGSAAVVGYYHDPNGLATVTGIVMAWDRNSIEIMDRDQKRPARFIYLEKNKQLSRGEYVRVFYHPLGTIVVNIMKMTASDYKKNRHNMGNIVH